MKTKHRSSGYIMIFTLLVIAACMVILTYVGHRASVHGPFMHMAIEREKAKILVMSGINIALSQLSATENKQENPKKPDNKNSKLSENNEFLQRILPTLNRWQTFTLHEDIDGVDAEILLCLMCEEGKINLNELYNFKKQEFNGDKEKGWKSIFQELCKNIEKNNKIVDLFPAFEKAFKEQNSNYNDATELIEKKEFSAFKDLFFYEPPQTTGKKNNPHNNIYLTDIFTVWSSSGKIEPWLFSNSLNSILGLACVEPNDSKDRKEKISGWLKNFKEKSQWQNDWKTVLQPMYEKELRTLPKNIDFILSTNFDPHFFSVRVHATVGEVTQRAYAILKRTKYSQEENVEYDVILKKLYWL